MKSYILTVIIMLLTHHVYSSTENQSPWLFIENKTPFDMVCTIEVMHHPVQNIQSRPDDNIIVRRNNANHEYEYVSYDVIVQCPAHTTHIIDSIFTINGQENYHPKITTIIGTLEELQIATTCTQHNKSDRYIILEYHPDRGISSQCTHIPIFIQSMNSIKKIIKNIVSACLNAANWLP